MYNFKIQITSLALINEDLKVLKAGYKEFKLRTAKEAN